MKIALLGYGKMGKTIEQLLHDEYGGQHEIILKINRGNAASFATDTLGRADVAIEFSTPDTVEENILKCFAANVPVVVGTTAWQHRLADLSTICKAQNQTLFHASNFSIGVNIFFALNRHLATLMNQTTGYQAQIEEIHHLQKLDAPSGTAVTLANDLIAQSDTLTKWQNEATAQTDTLPIISLREADVKGTHLITYQSAIDSIEIKHTAFSRIGFAKGAILAAEWVQGKKGVFTMRDLLGIG